jgi:hypothetical protein
VPDTNQKSRFAILGRYALGKVSFVLGKEFLRNVLRGRKPDTAKRPVAKIDYSDPVELPNGNTAYGTIRNGVLDLVVLTDKSGNTLEMEPEFFNTSLLKLKKDVVIPKFE